MNMNYKDRTTDELESIPNPIRMVYNNIHHVPEITFLGSLEQPDFAELWIEVKYDLYMIELKSLKKYFYQWRNIHVSYERFVECVYNDLMTVYRPQNLKLTLKTKPRGGISTTITV